MLKLAMAATVVLLVGCGGSEEMSCQEVLDIPRDAACYERPGGGVLQCDWTVAPGCVQSVTFNVSGCAPLSSTSTCL